MTLQEAEFVANEFNKSTSVLSAEVVPNVDGDYSVLVTRTDGRRAISRDLGTADEALAVVKIEEDYALAVYATLGEGNVPVFCSRETWKAWWEANPGGKVVKSEQSGDFVTEITFTGFLSERDRAEGPPKFWTVDSYNTKTSMCYSLGSFATLEEAVAFLESAKGPSSEK
ncbi:MAG: hypothetical protein WB586_05975 [Chthoniobacterales bacterium]|jgi:hypothetical protein